MIIWPPVNMRPKPIEKTVQRLVFLIIIVFLAGFLAGGAAQESSGHLYRRAELLEHGHGDLEGAIKIYRRIVGEFPRERRVVARSLLRIGICYERLGIEGAMAAYREILESYIDQRIVVREASDRLARLRSLSTSDLAPLSNEPTQRRVMVFDDTDRIRPNLARISPDGQWLVSVSRRDFQLWLKNLEDGETRLLVAERIDPFGFVWSRDSRQLAFFGRRGLETIEMASGTRSIILETMQIRRRRIRSNLPDWSPDGSQLLLNNRSTATIAFFSLQDYTVTPLITSSHNLLFARLSPDGQFVAYCSQRNSYDHDIYLVATDGEGVEIQLTEGLGDDKLPIWSPDGRFVLFLREGQLWAVQFDLQAGSPIGKAFSLADLGSIWPMLSLSTKEELFFRKSLPHAAPQMFFVEVDSEVATSPGEAKPLLAEGTLPCDGIPCAIWSKDESKIYYWKGKRPAERNLDSGGERSIGFPTSHSVGFYSLSGDSRSFAFFGWDQHKRPGIYEYMSDGDEIVPLSTWEDGPEAIRLGLRPYPPLRWSPDGTKIAFEQYLNGNGDIYVVNIDGSKKTRLTTNPATDNTPDWSRDGSQISFQSQRDGTQRFDGSLYIMNQDGSNQRSIFFSPELFCSAWSQEGSKIIFGALQQVAGTSQEYVDIFTINPDGTNLTRITTSADGETYPSISPDGQRIVYMVEHRLFVMNIDGTGSHRLDARGRTDEDPAWSPEITEQKLIF